MAPALRMTGHAPLNAVYRYADRFFVPGSMILTITRCKYATLALMARNQGDLSFQDVPRQLRSRLDTLASWGLVRRVPQLRRYELTAEGWRVLNASEAAWRLAQESKS